MLRTCARRLSIYENSCQYTGTYLVFENTVFHHFVYHHVYSNGTKSSTPAIDASEKSLVSMPVS